MSDSTSSNNILQIVGVSITEQASAKTEASGRVIANFAWQHLKAATIFRDHVIEIEYANAGQPFGPFFTELRSYASGCIMSSTASLEALINELFIAQGGHLRTLFNDFETEFWGVRGDKRKKGIEGESILGKYQIALDMIGKRRFKSNSRIYQDAWGLIELRNALVHYKPTWDPDRQRIIDLKEVLGQRFELSPFLDSGADFISMQCMSACCVKWAVSSVFSFMHAFDERTRLDDGKMAGFWDLEK